MGEAARKIYQQVLDELTEGVVSCNYDLIRPRLALPHLMVTSTARLVAETEEEMREVFMTFAMSLRQLGITEYTRIAHECEFVSENVISGHHTSHFAKDGAEIFAPYPSMCLLEKRGGVWMLTEAQNAIDNSHWPILLPDVPEPPLAGCEGPTVRLRNLQALMDRISDAFVQGDFDLWRSCVDLPLTMISRSGPQRFETEQDLRKDFEIYLAEIEQHGITDIYSTAVNTQRVGPDQTVGIYRTHILRDNEQVVPSWQAGAVLRKREGRWRIHAILRNIGHNNWSAASADDIETITTNPHEEGDSEK